MDKNQLKHIIKEEYQNVKSFMEDKYGFTPELGKVISNPYAKSFVNEVSEPEVISQLRDIVNKKQNKKIKDPKSGKMMRVDMFSASAIVKVYDAINKSNKDKFGKLSLPKMVNVAFSVIKKESVNEGYGDWVKAKNLTDIIKLSKQKKNATFYVTDDNNSRIGTFYLKNGKFAKATTANPNYDFQRNKTNLKDRSDVIYKYKVDESVNEGSIKKSFKVKMYGPKMRTKGSDDVVQMIAKKLKIDRGNSAKDSDKYNEIERQVKKQYDANKREISFKINLKESVNEAYVVLYSPKKGVKPVTTAAYKDKKDAEKWAKDLGGITMIVKKKVKGIDEGKKRFRQQDGIGKSKYTISYHDGKQKHKDGSDFFGIKIFKNKKDLESFRKDLKKQGYIEESVNEGMFKTIDQIRQDSKDAKDFIKNIFSDPDFKDMKNDREFLKYLKSIYEGFSSDAQRRAAFASGYKAKGKKGKKESIEEYDVENYQDVKEFVEFMREYKADINEAEYQGRDVKLGKIMQGDVKKFKVYVKNPKGNVVKVNFGHKGKGGEKTMRIKKSDPARRKAFRSRHNCDNPGPRHKARYWACRTW